MIRLAMRYQSEPNTSLPAGVQANHHVVGDRPADSVRTLASPRVTTMQPECGEAARPGLQFVKKGDGCCCHFEFGPIVWPVAEFTNQGPQLSASHRFQRLPLLPHRPYLSAKTIVFEVPSWKVAGILEEPFQSVI